MDNQQLATAHNNIKNAWIAGVFSASITLIFSILGAISEDFRFKYGFDLWTLLDAALIAGLAYGIYRKNRYCAVILFVYFVISKIGGVISTGQFTGAFMAIVIAYFYFQGAKATFQIHKHKSENQEISQTVKSRGIGFYIALFFGSIISIIFIFLLIIGSIAPELEVLPGKQINKKYLNFIRDQGIVDYSEKIHYWYSNGMFDFKEGFYFFTDEKVVVYCKDWEEPAIITPYSDIIDIQFFRDSSFLEDSEIDLLLKDSSTVFFPVSSDNDGDLRFKNKLIQVWNSNNLIDE